MCWICFTPNYLCPCYHPSLFHSSIPLVLSCLWPDVCSPAALRWLRGTDGTGLYGACVRSNTRGTHTRTGYGGGTRYSRDPGLLSQNLKMSFCFHFPRFHALAAYVHVNMKQMPQTHMWLKTNMDCGQRRSGIFFFFPALIGLEFLFCASG